MRVLLLDNIPYDRNKLNHTRNYNSLFAYFERSCGAFSSQPAIRTISAQKRARNFLLNDHYNEIDPDSTIFLACNQLIFLLDWF